MRALIVGGGCRGLELARRLAADGHAVRVVTRTEAGRAAIEAAGAECWIGDPDRIGTLRYALENVTLLLWLLGTASGDDAERVAALHGSRLRMMLEKTTDTTVRGVVYEAAGTLPAEVLEQGAEEMRHAQRTNEIPFALVDGRPARRARRVARAMRSGDRRAARRAAPRRCLTTTGTPVRTRADWRDVRTVLAVVTSHDRFDNVDKRTGLWLGELTHFHERIRGRATRWTSSARRAARCRSTRTASGMRGGPQGANRAFQSDPQTRALLEDSRRPDEVSPGDYAAIYFAGGHGAMWDFPDDPGLIALAEGDPPPRRRRLVGLPRRGGAPQPARRDGRASSSTGAA